MVIDCSCETFVNLTWLIGEKVAQCINSKYGDILATLVGGIITALAAFFWVYNITLFSHSNYILLSIGLTISIIGLVDAVRRAISYYQHKQINRAAFATIPDYDVRK